MPASFLLRSGKAIQPQRGLGIALLIVLFWLTPASRTLAAAPRQQPTPKPFYQLDSTFGQGGVRRSSQAFTASSAATLVTSDTEILAFAQDSSIAVQRFRADSNLDTNFGNNGTASVTLGTDAHVTTVVTQTTGAIVILGTFGRYSDLTPGTFHVVLVRFTANGQLDTSFGSNGVEAVPSTVFPNSMAVQDDDALLLVGQSGPTSSQLTFWMARYTAQGALDQTFGSNGMRTFTQSGYFSKVLVQPDGMIVATGIQSECGLNGCNNVIILVRIRANGTSDPAFGTDGMIADPRHAQEPFSASFLTIDPQGRIVVGADATSCPLMRYTTAGEHDTSFGTDGQVRIYNEYAGGAICTFGQLADDSYAVADNSYGYGSLIGDPVTVARIGSDGTILTRSTAASNTLKIGVKAVIAGPGDSVTLTGFSGDSNNKLYVAQARFVALPAAGTLALPLIQKP